MFAVLRLYVKNEWYSGVFVEAVAKTREQAFGHACQLATKFAADNKGCTVVNMGRWFSVRDANGDEVRYVVHSAVQLDSSNYKPT